MRFLSEESRRQIRSTIERKYAPGPERNAQLFRWLCGRKAVPRRRDFIETFIRIQHKLSGEIVPFRFNRPQRHVEARRIKQERAGKPVRMAILKARQWGLSTMMLAGGL